MMEIKWSECSSTWDTIFVAGRTIQVIDCMSPYAKLFRTLDIQITAALS